MTAPSWFRFGFDEHGVHRQARPPGQAPWSDSVAWADIERVCLEMADLFEPDTLYIFSRLRPESCVFPLESEAGQELLHELIRRQLFDAKLAIEAASGEGLFCWPKKEG